MQADVVIIGAGAAGLMCAIEAGKRGRNVLLLDHAKKPAEKIRISGGGRCNFTNLHCSPADFISQNSRFCVSALSRYTQQDFIQLVEKYGITYHEKTLGQLFCDGSSQQIIDMLLTECKQAGVTLQLETSVNKVEKVSEEYVLESNKGRYQCASLVIASGGKSIPKMGATGFGYDVARQFGLNIIEPQPALVPFTFEGEIKERMLSLAGVSANVVASYGKTQFEEGVLFTHRGLSGPAILQISSYWEAGQAVRINFAPGVNMQQFFQDAKTVTPKLKPANLLHKTLPKKLAEYVCEQSGCTASLAETSNQRLGALASLVNDWQVLPSGTEGYRTAEVTKGGVDTSELSSKTFESKKSPKLYFIGEVVDVTGHLGGFNFQWAWASGHAAGQYV